MDIAIFENMFKRALKAVAQEEGIEFKDSMEKNAFIDEKAEFFKDDVLDTLDVDNISNTELSYEQILEATKKNKEKIFAPVE